VKKPEILSPAGDLEKLKTAVLYGADAVYIGGRNFSLRSRSKNFSNEQMKEGFDFAHSRQKKVYVAVNVFARNSDFDTLPEYIDTAAKAGADAFIISDPGVFAVAKEVAPKVDIHISTQANVTSFKTVEFWKNIGASRIVLARELNFEEITEISKKVSSIELECFVHGAMCVSYSGRCILSNALTARSGNRGECSQPCRYEYAIAESTRPNEYFPIEEDSRGSYVLNSKDLRMIEYIPELINAGISSFKIEGRMKTPLYVGAATSAYRQAIDDYFENEQKYKENIPQYIDKLSKASSRDFCTGFYFAPPDESAHIYSGKSYVRSYDFAGIVLDYDNATKTAEIEQRNKFSVGDEVEFLCTDGRSFVQKIQNITANDVSVQSAPHPLQKVKINVCCPVAPFDMMIKSVSSSS
jgi:putative protease